MPASRSVLFVAVAIGLSLAASGVCAQEEDVTERYSIVKKTAGDKAGPVDSGRIGGVTVMNRGASSAEWYGLSLPPQKLYSGIIPGVRNSFRNSGWSSRRRSNSLTWIGLQKMPDRTRVFIQTGTAPSYRLERGNSDNELVVVLSNTKISLSNFWRNMDARYFPRSITSIRSYRKRKSGETRVVIKLRQKVEFVVSSEGNYVYVDFQDSHLEPEFAPQHKPKTVYDDPQAQ